jgi:hypothetical protein
LFKPNKRHLQPLLISNINDLPENLRRRLENSWASVFYQEFFYLLVEALPDLKERTGLQRLYTDGPYAGPKVDEVLQTCQVEQIQTGINGKVPAPDKLHLADFEIQQNEAGVPTQITCPQGQTASVHLSSHQKGYQADFYPQVC